MLIGWKFCVGLIKEEVIIDMKEPDLLLRFWYYCIERRDRARKLTTKNCQLHDSNPCTELKGKEGDI